ncbi:MAG: Alanine dehydrogenase 2 [Syntrophorhabdus sp. PtaU1.Bin058]|nr:MAG: Alanine dehydrogenase 2 [Syntrophorhabdus sp. PtaU1.Bin058]
MIVGVPKEIKAYENRVAIIPAGVEALVKTGNRVIVEANAGLGSGIADEAYLRAGAEIAGTNVEVFEKAEMIMKVKEPLPPEYPLFREDQVVFTYFHLAPVPDLTMAMLKTKIVGIAYETIQLDDGSLPLLTPMSEVAGRMSIHVGEYSLQKERGGKGVLLGGVPGVEPGVVVIIGGGVVGTNAAKMALGTGADVYILDVDVNRLRYLDDIFGGRVKTVMSNHYNIERLISCADLVIGAVLVTGAKAPNLITRDMLPKMQEGSVIVDVAVDQGGCVETTHPTYHDDPTFKVDGIVHYCVANMPGAVARTSTFALTNATLPYALKLANLGHEEAMKQDRALRKGLNVYKGKLVCRPVAEAQGMECEPIDFCCAAANF